MAASDRAELSTLRSQLEDLTERVVAVASRYDDTSDSAVAGDLFAAERAFVGGRRVAREHGRRDLVDRLVGALGREDRGHEELVRVVVHERAQLARFTGILLGEAAHDLLGALLGSSRSGHVRTIP